MSDHPPTDERAVDRREETVVTREPGYAATERVTRDVAAERRQGSFQFSRIVWTLVGILVILLGLRFMLKLIGANPDSGFTIFIYGVTSVFVAPFAALVGTPTVGGSVFEFTTLIAMAIYALLAWIIVRVALIILDRPSSRTVSRSVSEQSPDDRRTGSGSERTTQRDRRE
jgi:YggT family protein